MAPKVSVLGRFTPEQVAAWRNIGIDRFLWVAGSADLAVGLSALRRLQHHGEIAVFVPPFWEGDLRRLADETSKVTHHLVVSAQVLRMRRTGVLQRPVNVFAEALWFDEPVDLTIDSEIDTLRQPCPELYVAVGVGTTTDLPQLLEEGALYPDHDYLTHNELQRLGQKYPVHWGGNLPLEHSDWMVENFPGESRGFFVTANDAFSPQSANHVDMDTLGPAEIPRSVCALRAVCDALGSSTPT